MSNSMNNGFLNGVQPPLNQGLASGPVPQGSADLRMQGLDRVRNQMDEERNRQRVGAVLCIAVVGLMAASLVSRWMSSEGLPAAPQEEISRFQWCIDHPCITVPVAYLTCAVIAKIFSFN